MKKIILLLSTVFALQMSIASAYYTYPSYNNYGYTNVNSVTTTGSYTTGCTTYYYDVRTGAAISSKNICTATYGNQGSYLYGNTYGNSYNPNGNYNYGTNYNNGYNHNGYSYSNSNYTDYSAFTGYNNSYDAIIDGTYCNYGYNCANRAVTTYPQYNYQAWGYQNSCYSYYDTYYGYYKSSCGY